MTGQAIAPASETAARARENGEYVRSLLRVRQPQFAVALESAVQKLLRDHGMVCASSQRTDRSTVTGSAAGVITRRTPRPRAARRSRSHAGSFTSLETGTHLGETHVRNTIQDHRGGRTGRCGRRAAAARRRSARRR